MKSSGNEEDLTCDTILSIDKMWAYTVYVCLACSVYIEKKLENGKIKDEKAKIEWN